MGIQCLLQSLKSIQTNVSIAKYSGMTVGVDAYCWLHKGIYTCMNELVLNKPTTKYVDYCMKRVRMLKNYDIRPFIVFDGGLLPAKDHAEALRDEKVEYMVAPYEADAQLAYLERKNRIQAIITEDSDLLVFGCKTVCLSFDIDALEQRFQHELTIPQKLTTGDIQVRLGWKVHRNLSGQFWKSARDKHDRLDRRAISSYDNARYRTADKVLMLLRAERRLEIPPDYLANFKRAELAFLYQRVFDIDTQRLVTLNPIPEGFNITQDNEYIGPDLDPTVAAGIATGDLNPLTKQPMSDIPRLEETVAFKEVGADFGLGFYNETVDGELHSNANWYSVIPDSYEKQNQVAFQVTD
ncbi:3742_t:CDS:2 [Acaulospora colombiana]|uniref:3742_t:CDS:1 n=1 Tax=Acaulospora colombiana TaxID=27376 RepID=A0ACA9KH61_9GLOM|nr:3742_t:CDS:2 [Acaulospora colombiana]